MLNVSVIRDDPCSERDLLAAQFVGVAGAVQLLVVVADDPGQLGVLEVAIIGAVDLGDA